LVWLRSRDSTYYSFHYKSVVLCWSLLVLSSFFLLVIVLSVLLNTTSWLWQIHGFLTQMLPLNNSIVSILYLNDYIIKVFSWFVGHSVGNLICMWTVDTPICLKIQILIFRQISISTFCMHIIVPTLSPTKQLQTFCFI
jgi:hypothetical protein